ncbi:MAG: CoA-binding protein [Blastocatellia bacterium]|nr:CoA-binding protein [Blastocatellia bacterium]
MDSSMLLISSNEGIAELLRSAKTLAILGIKPETHSFQPAFYVSDYMQKVGYNVVPVPVYYPDVTTILGVPVRRKVAEIEEPVDMVVVFRRPGDIPPHLEDIIAAKPSSVWFQSGIRNDAAARVLAGAGIKVVQDKCIMVEHRTLIR